MEKKLDNTILQSHMEKRMVHEMEDEVKKGLGRGNILMFLTCRASGSGLRVYDLRAFHRRLWNRKDDGSYDEKRGFGLRIGSQTEMHMENGTKTVGLQGYIVQGCLAAADRGRRNGTEHRN